MKLSDKGDSRWFGRIARWTLMIAGVVVLVLLWLDPEDFSLAYRFVVFVALAPAVGCLIFTLIHRMTGGQWASELAPFLLAGVSLLPWIWLLALPVLFLPPALNRHAPSVAAAAHGYAGAPMVAMRSLFYAVVFFGLNWAVAGEVGRDSSPTQNRRPWVGPVGSLVLVFTLTLLSDDWIASLDSGWHSTGFAFVWMTGQAVAGLSLALLGGLAAGAQPGASGSAGRPLGLDWGRLVMATLLSWCYVAFAQFLIIWAGNLPAEISWFKRRSEGWWFLVPAILGVFSILIPFLLLLSRRYKSSSWGLAVVAVMLILGQGLYTAWLILPSAGRLSPMGGLLALALLVAGGAVFVDRFSAAARRLGRSTR